MSFGPNPWQQAHWDWRAALNFMCGGTGSGLIVATAASGGPRELFALGALLVASGLLSVWFEIGRPWRALHVYFNPRRSWMTREAWCAALLLPAALCAAFGLPGAALAAAALALTFVFCQGCILRAARGIPAWREPRVVPLIMATAMAEGGGLLLCSVALSAAAPPTLWAAFALVLLARLWSWRAWRTRLHGAPKALAAIDQAGHVFKAATLLPLAAVLLAFGAPLHEGTAAALQVAAGALALAGGLWFKFTLITRGAFNQGFAIAHLPVRGVRRMSPPGHLKATPAPWAADAKGVSGAVEES